MEEARALLGWTRILKFIKGDVWFQIPKEAEEFLVPPTWGPSSPIFFSIINLSVLGYIWLDTGANPFPWTKGAIHTNELICMEQNSSSWGFEGERFRSAQEAAESYRQGGTREE